MVDHAEVRKAEYRKQIENSEDEVRDLTQPGVCHKARLQRWNQQLNHCIDAVVRGTLKLEKKQSIYRKLGFHIHEGSVVVVCCRAVCQAVATLSSRDPPGPLRP